MTRLTCRDAEALSGIPASTWRRWISEGRLAATTTKGVLHITANDAIRLATLREQRKRLPHAC